MGHSALTVDGTPIADRDVDDNQETTMIQTGYSTKTDPEVACGELAAELAGTAPRLVLFFASPAFEPRALGKAMQGAFPDAILLGCTSAGEIAAGQMLKHSVVAMAIPDAIVPDLHVEVIEGLGRGAGIAAAMRGFEAHFGKPLSALDLKQYVGLILMDGLSLAEERLLEELGDRTDLTFIGGSAGDDLAFKATYVFANGRVYGDAAVLAVLHTPRGFDTIKTQSFRPTSKRLIATRVDERTRTVMEFNGLPASEAYAAACGTTAAELPGEFMHSPLGLMVGDEPYVRSPQQVKGSDVVFYCNIKEGTELNVLASNDIVADTRAVVQAKLAQLGPVAGLVNFHCILRTLELEHRGTGSAYGQVFEGLPAIGFSTYGEAFIGHINQTSTMLILQ